MAENSNGADADIILGAYRDNESVLKAYLRRFTNNSHDVEDICQETVLRALEAVRSRAILEPGPFLFGVARNIVRNNFAKKSRNLIDFVADFSPDEYVSETPSPEQALDEQQHLLLFGEAVASLPAQCQQVFVLKKVKGYSHKDIARMLDISVSTVEKHVAMGLKRCSDFVTRRAGRDAYKYDLTHASSTGIVLGSLKPIRLPLSNLLVSMPGGTTIGRLREFRQSIRDPEHPGDPSGELKLYGSSTGSAWL